MTRRALAYALAALRPAAAAQTASPPVPEAAPADAELLAARERVKANSAALAKLVAPLGAEPAVTFKVQ